MTRPETSATTERVYARLPEFYRTADGAQGAGPDQYPLLRFLSLVGDQAGEVEALLDRIDFVAPDDGGITGDTSDLVDPEAADDAWLPWLAQLVGIRAMRAVSSFRMPYGSVGATWPTQAAFQGAFATYTEVAEGTNEQTGGDLTAAELRSAITTGLFRDGSRESVKAAARHFLTGDRHVDVFDHYGGDPWRVLVRTYTAETPDPWAVQPGLVRANVTPAGVELVAEVADGASYGQLAAEFPTIASLEAALPTYADATNHLPEA